MRTRVQPVVCKPDDCCPPDAEPRAVTMGPEDEQELADLARALGHPARVTILRVLLERNVCVAGELAEVVPLAASTVSQHLKVLKEAGLIKGEVDGPRRCYCADRTVVGRFRRLLGALDDDRQETLAARSVAASCDPPSH